MRYFLSQVPKWQWRVTALILLAWSWHTFKILEPKVWPVVTGFVIYADHTKEGNNTVSISGELNKERLCKFVQVLAYDISTHPKRLLEVKFPRKSPTSRGLGLQFYGPWVLSPKSRNISIDATSSCSTGEVVTELYRGVL